jgi:hypothetical protein
VGREQTDATVDRLRELSKMKIGEEKDFKAEIGELDEEKRSLKNCNGTGNASTAGSLNWKTRSNRARNGSAASRNSERR